MMWRVFGRFTKGATIQREVRSRGGGVIIVNFDSTLPLLLVLVGANAGWRNSISVQCQALLYNRAKAARDLHIGRK